MQREIITIPPSLFTELKMTWDIDWRGQSAGETNAGTSRTVYNAFPRWVGQPEVFLNKTAISQWRAIRAQAQGRVGLYRMPMYDPVGFNDSDTGLSYPTGIPFSTGEPFSTGYGFAFNPYCRASGSAAAGATTLRARMLTGNGTVKVGQILSHNDWPFVVVGVTLVSSGLYDLDIQMPLREAISNLDEILMQGVGLFEATDEGMGNPVYGVGQFSRVKMSFREVLNR